MNVNFRKKGHPIGTHRNYGPYGEYEKQADGKWKRLRKGYPTFRRTLSFRLMKSFLSTEKGYGEAFLDSKSGPMLRKLLSVEGWTRAFNRWVRQQKESK